MKLIENRRMAPVVGDYGIEIEVEGANLPEMENKWWTTKADGSLRGESFEYVTNGAVEKRLVKNVMNNLNQGFIRKESILNLSYRTSVHVHMNVQELELEKILSTVYLYYIFEESIIKLCGDSRIGNRFCLRLRDAEDIVNIIRLAFDKHGAGIRLLDEGRAKYCSLNLVPMKRFGSIEFRSMRGTTNTETIVQWVNILDCLKSNQFKSAKEVSQFADENGIGALAIAVFGKLLPFLQFEGWEYEAARNMSLLIEIPNTISFPNKIEQAVNKLEEAFNMPKPPVAPRGVRLNYAIMDNPPVREIMNIAQAIPVRWDDDADQEVLAPGGR